MNNCPNCKLHISSQNYSYCPYCGYIIRKLELSYPEKVYSGRGFQVVCSARGSYGITVKSISLNGDFKIQDEVQINPESSKSFDMKIDKPGTYTLIVKANVEEITRTIKCSNLGYFPLKWQNIQVLDLSNISPDRKIYLSKELSDRSILPPSDKTSSFDIRKISILVSGNEYNCTKGVSGFDIPNNFFELLAKDEDIDGDLEVVSHDKQCIRIAGLHFHHAPEIPDIKLKSEDYVNTSPLNDSNCDISYILSYELQDNYSDRPLNNIRVKYLSNFVDDKYADSYFDDEQKIQHNVKINLARLIRDNSENTTARLEFNALFRLREFETEFCRYFNITFRVRRKRSSSNKDINKVVAIDFGTSNTCIAYLDEAGNIEQEQKPTTLKFHKFSNYSSDDIVFGQDIGDEDTPLTFATNFKPRLVRDEKLFYFDRQMPINNRPLKPSSLTKLYLTRILDWLFYNTDPIPGKALISYPASFSTDTRLRLHEVTDSLGLKSEPALMLTEPENIALYFALSHDPRIRDKIQERKLDNPNNTGSVTICVFDCGGGTTDVSVVRVSEGDEISFEILTTWGTDEFSGNYITYMVGKSIDGEEDWFPKNFSLLYTAKNEELKKYFQKVQHYEAIKCNSLETYAEQMPYSDLKTSIRKEIRALFDTINENILYLMFKNHVLDKTNTDFFILAGNSCRLRIFNEEAEECYQGSKIIWKPEEGKKAVALGSLKAYELAGSLNIRGTSRSNYEYLYRHGLGTVTLFEPFTDMNDSEVATSKYVNPTNIPILGRHIIDGLKKQPTIKFSIPPPPTIYEGFKYRFKLRFVKKTMNYAWVAENGTQIEETEFEPIYKEN